MTIGGRPSNVRPSLRASATTRSCAASRPRAGRRGRGSRSAWRAGRTTRATGASNAMSTPSKPCRSSSSLSSAAQRLVEVREHRVERHVDGQHGPTLTVTCERRGVKNAVRRCPTERLRRGPLLQLPVRADASGPAGDGRDPARAASRRIPFHARVLEIGCGAGGNLIAMAAATPGIRARRGRPRARGRSRRAARRSREIGLTNVELRQGDVARADDGELGRVRLHRRPRRLRLDPGRTRATRCWRTIAAHLAPDGVAYVSYNAQPGGYFRRMLRDAGLWHARGDRRPDGDAPRKAQELYRFLNEQRATDADTYGALLEREVPPLADGPLYRLVHDDLSEHWQPVLVRRVRRARGRATGSRYVGEADL